VTWRFGRAKCWVSPNCRMFGCLFAGKPRSRQHAVAASTEAHITRTSDDFSTLPGPRLQGQDGPHRRDCQEPALPAPLDLHSQQCFRQHASFWREDQGKPEAQLKQQSSPVATLTNAQLASKLHAARSLFALLSWSSQDSSMRQPSCNVTVCTWLEAATTLHLPKPLMTLLNMHVWQVTSVLHMECQQRGCAAHVNGWPCVACFQT
jgi:hypothetical protein